MATVVDSSSQEPQCRSEPLSTSSYFGWHSVRRSQTIFDQFVVTAITAISELWKGAGNAFMNLRRQDSQHRRITALFTIEIEFPKLDVAGSIPVSRSIKSTT
jgi:hypothetical protein